MSLKHELLILGCTIALLFCSPAVGAEATCPMSFSEALQIVRSVDQAGKEVDAQDRIITGQFYVRVPAHRIAGSEDAKKSKYFLKMNAALAGKQVWVIDADLVPGPGVRGWNLRFFVDACERKEILRDMR